MRFTLKQPITSESLLGEQNEGQIWTKHALKRQEQRFFSTNSMSMTLKFAKILTTLGVHYKAIPNPEPTLPE